MPAINTTPSATDAGPQAAWEFNPEISADGTLLVFTSLRPGGHGLGDLYASRFVRGEWTRAENLGPAVNTAADEYHPTLSRDRKQLYSSGADLRLVTSTACRSSQLTVMARCCHSNGVR